MNYIFQEFSKFSTSLSSVNKKLDANFAKLYLKISNLEKKFAFINQNNNYNETIDINNENFKKKNLSQIYIDKNLTKNKII